MVMPEELNELYTKRLEQLERETPGTYNYGYVAGEVAGIRKAITILGGRYDQTGESNGGNRACGK